MEKKFRIISILFIIGCFIYYGGRFGYYYMKYKKKSSNTEENEVLAVTIQKQGIVSSGDGLYNNNGELIYKGKNVNNYLSYSNILWRIVKVNSDNSIVLVTDSKINDLAYGVSNSTYLKSNINDYLNKSLENTGIFETILNNKEKLLTKNTLCLDDVNNIKKITCKNKDTNMYVSLLSVSDYLNSKNSDSYINNVDTLWLYNKTSDNKAWYINNGKLLKGSTLNMHGVKAVITLKNTIGSISGDGSLNNPYKIEKDDNEVSFNKYVKLGNDLYTINDINSSSIKLVSTTLINDITSRSINYYNKNFDSKVTSSIAYYLNNKYYNSLSYKNILTDCTFYTGDYNKLTNYDYKNIYKGKVISKVGLLSIADLNLNNNLTDYFTLNKLDNKIYYVKNNDTNISSINKIRTSICIDKNTKLKGNGTKTNPFELEV